jgi:ubiquinone/menaquinone biosynthesis C-methylase UbiE
MTEAAPGTTEATEEVRHPLFARLYLRMTSGRMGRGEIEHRRKLLTGLSGRVIEVGAGGGLNFEFYPREVESVLAVEPEPTMREAAVEAAAKAPVEVQVVEGVAASLPAEDAAFDAAVCSLVLCSVSDQRRALAELRRVIRPGGELRFYEHVAAERPAGLRLQRFADATFWPRVSGGCHMARDTVAAIGAAGFEVDDHERFGYSPGPPVPALPHVLGIARRP